MNRTSRRNKLLLITGIVTAGAVALAGCSSSKASNAASTKPGKVTLVVYSAQGYDKVMTAAFTKATGIPVKLDDNSTGPLLTQIEASKNNPNWGLLWVDGATAFAGLDQQGLLQKGFEPSVQWDTLGQQSLPSDKSYTPTGVTLMAAMVYDKSKVTNPPSTWQQLLSSAYKGEVGMNDPSQSGPTYPFIAGMMNYLGGEQQRVALARALVADTGLILCDEPLSNLDADLRERMRLEISSLVREAGATTVYITHDQAEAFALADRVGILERGRLVQQGTPEEIYTQPATPFVARFTGLSGELPVQVRGAAADGTVEVELAGPAQARPFHTRGPSLPLGEAAALLMIRPTGVQLVASHTGEHHVTGTVADVAFRGRGYEHAIDIPGHGRLTSVFSDTRADRGEHVGLRLDPRGCHLFSAGPAAPALAEPASLQPEPAKP